MDSSGSDEKGPNRALNLNSAVKIEAGVQARREPGAGKSYKRLVLGSSLMVGPPPHNKSIPDKLGNFAGR